ncbi:MAG: DMT family transporter [Ilumatobacteraceae bacterium]
MDAALALVAAFLFAVAATLQQKGALNLPKVSLSDPSSLLKLIGQTMWLVGTIALLCGYVVQAIALDEGRLSIIQPLLVTTVVFALPLGYWLTDQHVGPREIVGAAVIMCGLALFTVLADPAGGNENAPNLEWAIAIASIAIASAALLYFGGRDGSDPGTRAAVYGSVAGMLFGLSAALTKPTLTFLSEGVGTMLSNWQPYVLAVAGILGFVLQQVSLGTGRLAPAVATVSTINPVVGILIGTILLDETWSRPAWHVAVAAIGLVVALGGAVVISLSSQAGTSSPRDEPQAAGAVATA